MIQLNGVSVELGRSMDDPRMTVFFVRVRSIRNPKVWSHGEVDPAKCGGAVATLSAVGLSAAAGAEYLNNKYGDNVDTEAALKLALTCCAEEAKLNVEASKGSEAVVARLFQNRHVFPDESRERIELWHWCQENGQQLTVSDRKDMGKALAALHAAGL